MSYCGWDSASGMDRTYHDTEWGVPVHDDVRQFEYLLLEVMQCGLSWDLMLRKRAVFRNCFDEFDFEKIALYGEGDVFRIVNTKNMIRSERKIRAIVNNAQRFLEIRKEFDSFSAYLWAFSGGKTILYEGHEDGDIPVSNALSERISRDLKKRGFKYLGPVVIYSHLQACGIINDHDKNCPRYKILVDTYPTVNLPREGENF